MYKRNYLKSERQSGTGSGRKLFWAAAILAIIYFLAAVVVGEMGVVKYYRMKAQHASLGADMARLRSENARLRREVHALRGDTSYLERVARDKLGLARPGEIVYYYSENQGRD